MLASGTEVSATNQYIDLNPPNRDNAFVLGLTVATYQHIDLDPLRGDSNLILGLAVGTIVYRC